MLVGARTLGWGWSPAVTLGGVALAGVAVAALTVPALRNWMRSPARRKAHDCKEWCGHICRGGPAFIRYGRRRCLR